MLSQLQNSYQRLEQSLQRLTDSIVSYNPSVAASEEVAAADDTICQDLRQLSQHQSNYARIHQLRETTASLDNTLKNTVRLLAETRREIQSIPVHSKGQVGKELQVDDLLSYAKFISRTSFQQASTSLVNNDGDVVEDGAKVNPDAIVSPVNGQIEQSSAVKDDNVGLKHIDDQTKRNLDPLRDVPFEPWPPYAVIQQGSLANIQRMRDAGKNPASVLSAEDQAIVDRQNKEQEEREEQEQIERDRRRTNAPTGLSGRSAAQDDVFDPDEA